MKRMFSHFFGNVVLGIVGDIANIEDIPIHFVIVTFREDGKDFRYTRFFNTEEEAVERKRVEINIENVLSVHTGRIGRIETIREKRMHPFLFV